MTDPKAKDKSTLEKLGEKIIVQVVEKAVDKFTDPILTYIKDFWKEFSEYLANFDEEVNLLELDCPGLTETRINLRNKVERELGKSPNMKQSTKVDEWYKKEEPTARDAAKLLEELKRQEGRLCLGKCCVGRLCYAKKVVKCRKRLKDVKDEGDKLISDRKFLDQGAPDGEELLSGFESEFRKLRNAIICIENLKWEVRPKLEASTTECGVHAVKAWVDKMDLEVRDGKLLTSRKEEHLKEFRNRGSGPPPPIQREVKSCTERILELQGEGEKHLKDLIAGASSSSNEAPPQPA